MPCKLLFKLSLAVTVVLVAQSTMTRPLFPVDPSLKTYSNGDLDDLAPTNGLNRLIDEEVMDLMVRKVRRFLNFYNFVPKYFTHTHTHTYICKTMFIGADDEQRRN